MKGKKSMKIIMCVLIVVCIAAMLVACDGVNFNSIIDKATKAVASGVYYMSEDGTTASTTWIELNDKGEWTTSWGDNGTYTFDEKNMNITLSANGATYGTATFNENNGKVEITITKGGKEVTFVRSDNESAKTDENTEKAASNDTADNNAEGKVSESATESGSDGQVKNTERAKSDYNPFASADADEETNNNEEQSSGTNTTNERKAILAKAEEKLTNLISAYEKYAASDDERRNIGIDASATLKCIIEQYDIDINLQGNVKTNLNTVDPDFQAELYYDEEEVLGIGYQDGIIYLLETLNTINSNDEAPQKVKMNVSALKEMLNVFIGSLIYDEHPHDDEDYGYEEYEGYASGEVTVEGEVEVEGDVTAEVDAGFGIDFDQVNNILALFSNSLIITDNGKEISLTIPGSVWKSAALFQGMIPHEIVETVNEVCELIDFKIDGKTATFNSILKNMPDITGVLSYEGDFATGVNLQVGNTDAFTFEADITINYFGNGRVQLDEFVGYEYKDISIVAGYNVLDGEYAAEYEVILHTSDMFATQSQRLATIKADGQVVATISTLDFDTIALEYLDEDGNLVETNAFTFIRECFMALFGTESDDYAYADGDEYSEFDVSGEVSGEITYNGEGIAGKIEGEIDVNPNADDNDDHYSDDYGNANYDDDYYYEDDIGMGYSFFGAFNFIGDGMFDTLMKAKDIFLANMDIAKGSIYVTANHQINVQLIKDGEDNDMFDFVAKFLTEDYANMITDKEKFSSMIVEYLGQNKATEIITDMIENNMYVGAGYYEGEGLSGYVCAGKGDVSLDEYTEVARAYGKVKFIPSTRKENIPYTGEVIHYDNNCDGKCDICGEEVPVQHIDEDNDGYCDKCYEKLENDEPNNVDENDEQQSSDKEDQKEDQKENTEGNNNQNPPLPQQHEENNNQNQEVVEGAGRQ